MQPALDESKERFTYGRPDAQLIRNFCLEKFGWNFEKVDQILDPVLKVLLSSIAFTGIIASSRCVCDLDNAATKMLCQPQVACNACRRMMPGRRRPPWTPSLPSTSALPRSGVMQALYMSSLAEHSRPHSILVSNPQALQDKSWQYRSKRLQQAVRGISKTHNPDMMEDYGAGTPKKPARKRSKKTDAVTPGASLHSFISPLSLLLTA